MFRSLLLALSIGFGLSSLVGCGDDAPDPTCPPWCTVVDECTDSGFSECMSACAEELSNAQAVSSECANAARSQNACLGELTCAEFETWGAETMPWLRPALLRHCDCPGGDSRMGGESATITEAHESSWAQN